MIDSYKELLEVKEELQSRLSKTEKSYIQQHDAIAYFLDIIGVYKNKKNAIEIKHLHSAIIQSVSEYIQELKAFKKYNKEYTFFVIPLALTLISAIIIKKI